MVLKGISVSTGAGCPKRTCIPAGNRRSGVPEAPCGGRGRTDDPSVLSPGYFFASYASAAWSICFAIGAATVEPSPPFSTSTAIAYEVALPGA